jgi:catechol 2,3-dioxygenase-like lactoylglutathione lyase family enzyme
MLDHVSITVSDIAAAERFYDAIMKVLGVVKVGRREDWLGYGERSRPAYPDRVYISIRKGPKPEEAFGRHWCFKAKWRTQIDAFWDAGIAAGGSDDGPPGVRNNYHTSYYAAFLRDPDGNRVSVIKRSEGQCKPDNRVRQRGARRPIAPCIRRSKAA